MCFCWQPKQCSSSAQNDFKTWLRGLLTKMVGSNRVHVQKVAVCRCKTPHLMRRQKLIQRKCKCSHVCLKICSRLSISYYADVQNTDMHRLWKQALNLVAIAKPWLKLQIVRVLTCSTNSGGAEWPTIFFTCTADSIYH